MLIICKIKKNKLSKRQGFTLIELLAVIVILAIIALIAVPQVIKILNKARLSSAEDSTYGIVKSVDTYVANFMLKNEGSFPNEEIKFNCDSDGCKLNTKLDGYNLEGLEELNFKGSKPTNGEVIVSNGGQSVKIDKLKMNGFNCYYPNSEGKTECIDKKNLSVLENKTYTSGEKVENFAGYNWHVISNDREHVTLLMDAGQIKDMAHCGSNNDSSNNCTFNGSHYVYSWDKSLINSYLKETLYPELKNKITNEIEPISVCVDPSREDNIVTYGGYLKTEINNISGASCSNYETDYVRLITYSEYFNLSPYYSEKDSNYPNVSGITRLSTDSDYASWLYCMSNKCGSSITENSALGNWWTMNSTYSSHYGSVRLMRFVLSLGNLANYYSDSKFGVRPVITIKK